jgi:hypothetical protein
MLLAAASSHHSAMPSPGVGVSEHRHGGDVVSIGIKVPYWIIIEVLEFYLYGFPIGLIPGHAREWSPDAQAFDGQRPRAAAAGEEAKFSMAARKQCPQGAAREHSCPSMNRRSMLDRPISPNSGCHRHHHQNGQLADVVPRRLATAQGVWPRSR